MYFYMLNTFRAANKPNYAVLCVLNMHTYLRMKPDIRTIWDRNRTVSKKGRPGRNMAWDCSLEKQNLAYSILVGVGEATEKRLAHITHQLNGSEHVRTRALEMIGVRDSFDDYNSISNGEVKKLSNAFKKALRLGEDQQHGRNDMEELGHHRPNSPFKRGNYFGNQAPWIKIETLRASTAEYVQNSLKKAPRTTIRE